MATDSSHKVTDSIVEVLRNLPSDQAKELFNHFKGDLRELIREAARETVPSAVNAGLRKVGYSDEVTGLARLLAAKSNDNLEDVFKKALTLYGVALDAREKGNRLAILSPSDEIVREIVGFDPSELTPPSLAK
jgi:hypothetical protein